MHIYDNYTMTSLRYPVKPVVPPANSLLVSLWLETGLPGCLGGPVTASAVVVVAAEVASAVLEAPVVRWARRPVGVAGVLPLLPFL